MDKVFWEFKEDTAQLVDLSSTPVYSLHPLRFVAKAEDLTEEYKFGVYDFLVLPESFPYGGELDLSPSCRGTQLTLYVSGMENSCLTFVTPTLVAGDRSEVDVVAHEISHVSAKRW